MNELKIYLESLIDFTDNEMKVFMALFSEIQLKKNDYFAKEGEYSSKLAFISNGVMRAFFLNNTGNEYNKTFFTPSNFVADFRKLTSLYKTYPKFESLARIIAEYKFAIKEKREIELVTMEATARYEIFKKEHPNLENLINQYHIASYLGITPTQLSRIRAKK